MRIDDYKVEVRKLSADLGGGFVAFVPQLMGCISDGDTAEVALMNLEDAVEMWIDAAREKRRPIPEPRLTGTAAAVLHGTAGNIQLEGASSSELGGRHKRRIDEKQE